MSADAVEVALGLLRAPSLRGSLRQRPLPGTVGELIEIAVGEPSRVARAAASHSAAPEQVLEAARFYIREILLFPGADAYRVLGVMPQADAAQIKLHYRQLQQWLHPDRRRDDWESVFATRINAAWADLRSPERRAAYDARPFAPVGLASPPLPPQRRLVGQWRASPFQQRRGLGWLAVGAGVAGCLWLAVLVNRQARAPVPEWNTTDESTTGEAVMPPPASLTSSFEAALEHAGLQPQASSATLPTADANAAPDSTELQATPLDQAAQERPPWREAATVQASARSGRSAYGEWVGERPDEMVAPAAPRAETQAPATMGLSPDLAAAPAALSAPPVSLEQVRLAHRCGKQLTGYVLGNAGPTPPIWHSVSAQDSAWLLRTRLGHGRVRVGDPVWRIGATHAGMGVRLQRADGPVDLQAEFTWRDGRWLVESVHTRNLR